MRRFLITLGAATTTGGKVISASSESSIDGVAIALEGDLVTCPVCKRAGKILCVGPRIPETWKGKHVALENDVCLCHCPTHPRLMASQYMRSQVIKDSGSALSNPPHALTVRGAPSQVFSERFVLVQEHDGAPLPNREYAVVRANGKLEFGTSDQQGQTHLLSATAQSESVQIFVQGPLRTTSLIAPSGAVLHYRARRRTTPAADASVKQVPVELDEHPALLPAGPAVHDVKSKLALAGGAYCAAQRLA